MATYSITKDVPHGIFRAYDIRGIVGKTLTPDIVYTIGLAIGSEMQDRGVKKVIVGRDGRISGPELLAALSTGLLHSGCDLINLGEVPTPVLYFATNMLSTNAGVMLTGSHNPTDYNGIKSLIGSVRLYGDAVEALYERIQAGKFRMGEGAVEDYPNIIEDYIEDVVNNIHLERPLKIVVDAGNGVTGKVIPTLFERLGCDVTPLFCEVDGRFPNHHPDPLIPENLEDLIRVVKEKKADVGLAFDGDGDRVGVVTNEGEIVWPDRQMMLFSKDILSRNPGASVVFDVKSTRNLPKTIKEAGGKPIMWMTGHSLIMAKMVEEDSPFSGELSGHLFFKERWYGFDDGMYSGCRMLELIANGTQTSSEIAHSLPDSVNTPELKLAMPEEKKFDFMERFIKDAHFENAEINTIDGLRADFPDGFGLMRPSNTSPFLILRFESDTQEGLERIEEAFRKQLLALDPDLKLPF